MHPTKIKEFLTYEKYASYTKASSKLNMSRTSLSKHIEDFEGRLGFALVDPNNGKRLTPAGKQFAEGVKPIIEQYDHVLDECRRIKNSGNQQLIVQEPHFTNDEFALVFYRLMEKFRTKYSNVGIRFVRAPYVDPLENLGGDKVDVALALEWAYEDVTERYTNADFKAYPLGYESLVVICEKTHPLANKEFVSIDDLRNYDIVSSSNKFSPFQITIRTMCKSRGFKPTYSILRKDLMLFIPPSDAVYLLPESFMSDPRVIAKGNLKAIPFENDSARSVMYLVLRTKDTTLVRRFDSIYDPIYNSSL